MPQAVEGATKFDPMGHPGIGEFLHMQQMDMHRRAGLAAQAEGMEQANEQEREHEYAALVLRVAGRQAR